MTAANKADLAAAVHERLSITKRDAEVAVDAVFDAVVKALAEGRDVGIGGFGKFVLKRQKARKARNPQTGEAVSVPARTIVLYRPSALVKEKTVGVE